MALQSLSILQENQLTVSYIPPEGLPRPDWIKKEYSRGGLKERLQLMTVLTRQTLKQIMQMVCCS